MKYSKHILRNKLMKKNHSTPKTDKDIDKSANDDLKKGSEDSVFDNDKPITSNINPDSKSVDEPKPTEHISPGIDAENINDQNKQSLFPKSIRKTEQLLINIIQKTTENNPTRAFVMNVGGATLFFIYNAN